MSQLAELRRYFEQTFKVNDFSYIRKINNVVTFENVLVLGEWGNVCRQSFKRLKVN